MNKSQNRSILIFLFIFIAFLTFIFATYKQYGVSWDESFYWYSGKLTAQHFFDTNFITKEISKKHLLTHGTFFDSIYYVLQKHDKVELDIERLHLVKALFSSLTLIAVYFILKALTNNSFVPIIGMVFLIFYPRWLGDIFDNHMESISIYLYAWQNFFGVKLLLEQNRNRIALWLFSLIILSAIAFSHRVILVGISILALLLFLFSLKMVRSKGKIICGVGLCAGLFLTVLFFVDPYIRHVGINGIFDKISVLLQTQTYFTHQVFFEGKVYEGNNLPWYYLPKWITISTPILSLLFFASGCFAIFYGWRGKQSAQRSRAYLFILLSFFLPIIIVALTRPVLFDGWRHFLFLVVPFVLIASLGIQELLKAKNRYLKITVVLLLFINILLTAREMLLLHPYEYVYFNSFVGGFSGAAKNYETDYWGKSFREATLWLSSSVKSDTFHMYRVFVCDSPDLAIPYFEKNMIVVDSLKQADYFICYTRLNADKVVDDSKTVFRVEREGVALNYVKKVR